jgi:hypothetical protein
MKRETENPLQYQPLCYLWEEAGENEKRKEELLEWAEKNPVFHDAICGVQTVEDSVSEIGEYVRGKRRFLPWGFLPIGKNKSHNNRINQIGELVPKPSNLYCSGIFVPNNLATVSAYGALGAVGLYSLLSNESQGITNELIKPIVVNQINHNFNILTSLGLLGLVSLGGLATSFERPPKKDLELPLDEARYVDSEIINEYYETSSE